MKHTILIKTVEIPHDILVEKGVNATMRKKFIKTFKKFLQRPSDSTIMDKLEEIENQLGIKIVRYNCRWTDEIGPLFRTVKPNDTVIEYLNEKYKQVDQELNDLPWYKFWKKTWLKESKDIYYNAANYYRSSPKISEYNSFTRQWFLDVYY